MLSLKNVFKVNFFKLRFSADGLWYRATILDVDQKAGHAKVLYVDYGNCEILPTTELREIPITFRVLPKQAILVEVDELKTMFPSAAEEFRNKMSQMTENWTIHFKVRTLEDFQRKQEKVTSN